MAVESKWIMFETDKLVIVNVIKNEAWETVYKFMKEGYTIKGTIQSQFTQTPQVILEKLRE